jgi:NAD(P)-dependent dehydrogenase (short-subunit alcohol dehydrogenase family)
MKIVITGVTRGLGRALAEWYIGNGHTVAGCGRSGPAIFDLRFTYPEPHSFDPLDVTQVVKVNLWAERVLGAMGVPDLLINNAALINTPAPLWKVSAAEFEILQVRAVAVAALDDLVVVDTGCRIPTAAPRTCARAAARRGRPWWSSRPAPAGYFTPLCRLL